MKNRSKLVETLRSIADAIENDGAIEFMRRVEENNDKWRRQREELQQQRHEIELTPEQAQQEIDARQRRIDLDALARVSSFKRPTRREQEEA